MHSFISGNCCPLVNLYWWLIHRNPLEQLRRISSDDSVWLHILITFPKAVSK